MRGFVLVVVVSGCNQMFDLDEPERVFDVADMDGDSIVDSRDNCPSVSNPEQADSDDDRRGDACDDCPTSAPTRDLDQDGVDDACDNCILGPQVDDDGDGVMDACDLCPITFGVTQLDDDGDLVGNACDEPSGQMRDNERTLFEPFTTLGPIWEGFADWELGGDGSSVTPTRASASLTHPVTDVFAAVSVSFAVAPDSKLSVDLADDVGCDVTCAGGTCALVSRTELGVPSEMPIQAAHGTLQLVTRDAGMMEFGVLICTVYVDDAPAVSSFDQTGAVRQQVTIRASSGVKVLGVDVIR